MQRLPAPMTPVPVRGRSLAWWLLLALVVVDRVRVMAHFAWRYTDEDQTLLWNAAYEMLHGRFHEPRWYGQDYNTLLESLLATPLMATGVPVNVAVPVATSVLCLAPFVLLSACALRRGWTLSAFAVLAMPLLLPLRYALLTSMPRGFVTGLVFATIPACLTLFRWSPRRLFACGFLLTLSLSINPSAAILAVPVAARVLLDEWGSRDLARWGGAGFLLAVVLHATVSIYYRLNPAHVVYGPGLPSVLAFHPALLWENVRHLGRYLGDVAPALPGGPWLEVLLTAGVLVGLVRRGARSSALALLAGAGITLLSLGLVRLHGGSESIWYPWSRNYLCVPLLLATGLVWLEGSPGRRLEGRARSVWLAAIGLAACVAFAARMVALDGVIARNLNVKNPVGVKAWSVAKVRERCASLAEMAARHGADLVVFRAKHEELAYGCGPVLDGRLETLLIRRTVAERRTWRLEEEATRPARAALLYNFTPQEIERGRSLGLDAGKARRLSGMSVVPAQLPAGRRAFQLFAAMGVPGAADLVARLDRLGVH